MDENAVRPYVVTWVHAGSESYATPAKVQVDAYSAEDAAFQATVDHRTRCVIRVEPAADEARSLKPLNATERLRNALEEAFPLVKWQIRTEDGPPPWPMVVIYGKSPALRYGPIAFRLEQLPAPDVLIAQFRAGGG